MEERKHLTALELLENKFDREKPVLSSWWAFIVGSTLGFSGACVGNTAIGRPLFASLHKHFIAALALGAAFHYARENTIERYAERDAMYRDYIQLHPDDFIIPEPKKVADILEDWYPTR